MAENDLRNLQSTIQQQFPLLQAQNQSTYELIRSFSTMSSQLRVLTQMNQTLVNLAVLFRNLQQSITILGQIMMRVAAPFKSSELFTKRLVGLQESSIGIAKQAADRFLGGTGEDKQAGGKDPSVNIAKAGKAMTGIGTQLGAQIPQMMMMMFVMKPIMDLLQGVLSAFEPLLELFGVFGEIIGTAFTPLINQLMIMILPAIPFMVDLMQKLGPIIQLLWNFLTPLGLLIQFFSNFDLIIREFQKGFIEIGKAFTEVGKAFKDAGSFIMGILDAIGKGFSVVFGAIGDAFNNFVNWIKGIINTLLGWAFGGADKDIFTPG